MEIEGMYEQLGISRAVYEYGESVLQGLRQRFDEIDQTVRSSLNFITTDHVDKILDVALGHRFAASAPQKPAKQEGRSSENPGLNIRQ